MLELVRRSRLPVAAAIAVLAVAMAACGGSSAKPTAGQPETADRAAQYRPDLGDVKLQGAESQALQAATDLQRDSAQDGILTFAEYEGAVLELVACYRAAGYKPAHGMPLTAYGYYYVEFIPFPEGGIEPGDKSGCQDPVLSVALDVWGRAKTDQARTKPVPQSLFQAAHAVLWGCMRDARVDLRGRPPGIEAAQALLEASQPEDLLKLRDCQIRVLLELGVPGWVG